MKKRRFICRGSCSRSFRHNRRTGFRQCPIQKIIRELTVNEGVLTAKGERGQKSEYEIYYDYREPVKSTPYRVLAINRGEREKFLTVKLEPRKKRA